MAAFIFLQIDPELEKKLKMNKDVIGLGIREV